MELEDFKSTWQSNLFITEVKEMSDIHKIVQKNTASILAQILKRYQRLINSALIGTVLFVLFFYTISDGFRESPEGVVFGVLAMLSVVGLGWSRYQQLLSLDYTSNLKERLQGLITLRQRSQMIEQATVVILAAALFIVPRLFNGRGFAGLTQPDMVMGLVLALLSVAGFLYLIHRYHQRDINYLQSLLAQLAE